MTDAALPELVGRGLGRTFSTGAVSVRALHDVGVEVYRGEFTAVTGPSGSGKTTLLNILGGLDRPDDGRVTLADGRSLQEFSESEVMDLRRRRIGSVIQDFALLPILSAAENVEVPLRLLRIGARERDERVAQILERVGLARHSHQRPSELSGGQQQRVGVARALVADPHILIADEPTGQLDSETAGSIMDLILTLTRERGLAAVLATHDQNLVDRADKVVELVNGRVKGSHLS